MRTGYHLIIAISLVGLLASCQSTEQMLDRGDYDALIRLAQRKLAGKKHKKARYVLALEEGFAKVTKRDMDRINALKQSESPDDWEKILSLAERIERRQERLEPFLPLIDKEGYQAKFEFVRTDEIAEYAEGQIVRGLYNDGLVYLDAGRNGNKAAARDAYWSLKKLFKYTDRYIDADALMEEARLLGIIHVRVGIENLAREWMPAYVASALTEPFHVDHPFWVRYRFDNESPADYEAILMVTDVSVGPESIHDEEVVRKREIEDGFDYVLDENGNVAKDSLGNDIKEVRYVTVKGVVVTTHQEKVVHIRARAKIRDLQTNVVVDTRPLQAEARFYHRGQSHYGDSRALDKEDRVFIGLLPFPSDEEMILEASELLKPVFIKEIERSRYI